MQIAWFDSILLPLLPTLSKTRFIKKPCRTLLRKSRSRLVRLSRGINSFILDEAFRGHGHGAHAVRHLAGDHAGERQAEQTPRSL